MFKLTLVLTLLITLATILHANPMRPDNINTPQRATNNAQVVAPKPTPRPPQLNSIVVMGDYRIANFSNKNDAQIGELISGYRLIQIEPTYVVVERDSKSTRLNAQGTGSLTIRPAEEDSKP